MPIEITIPGSKSLTNRALILGALTKGTTTIKNYAKCDDTDHMLKGLKQLGVKIEKKQTEIIIHGAEFHNKKEIKIFTGNAGTTTRFLTALSTTTNNKITINGDKRMQERPIKPLIEALNKIGSKITSKTGCPPLTIAPSTLKGGKITLPGNISSQYLSALLMITPFAEKKTTITLDQTICSKPYVNITISLLNKFGIKIKNNNFTQFKITPQTPTPPGEIIIEGDASSASYFGAFSALHKDSPITLTNIYTNSTQGDIKFLEYLKKMGCKITKSKAGTTITGPSELNKLREIDMNETPDLVMTFAVLAMFTPGETKIKNIPNLRIKETDRLAALENEINKFNIKTKTTKSSITIKGDPKKLMSPLFRKKKIKIQTYNDHRIAMCFGILKRLFPNIIIEKPECVSKSYPTFWKDLEQII